MDILYPIIIRIFFKQTRTAGRTLGLSDEIGNVNQKIMKRSLTAEEAEMPPMIINPTNKM